MSRPTKVDVAEISRLAAGGMAKAEIARVTEASLSAVNYHLNEKLRESRKASNRRWKERTFGRPIGPRLERVPEVSRPIEEIQREWDQYDVGDVWIEDRTISRYGVGSAEQREAAPRLDKSGSASLASWRKPENRPSPEPTVAPTHYVPAPFVAWDRYYKHGDVNAIADYVRSIGR